MPPQMCRHIPISFAQWFLCKSMLHNLLTSFTIIPRQWQFNNWTGTYLGYLILNYKVGAGQVKWKEYDFVNSGLIKYQNHAKQSKANKVIRAVSPFTSTRIYFTPSVQFLTTMLSSRTRIMRKTQAGLLGELLH